MGDVNHMLELAAFGKSPALSIDLSVIREAEVRIIEAKTVNPSTYLELEYTFNEAYRILRSHLATIGYQITLADKAMEIAKANVLFGAYSEHMAGKPKYQDNTDLRKAFFMRDADYISALDRFNQLKALEINFEGKIKVMENVCRYMRQQMFLLGKGGLADPALYVSSGDKNGKR